MQIATNVACRDPAWRALIALAVSASITASTNPGSAQPAAESVRPPSAVVVMYHRFGERALPSTNIHIAQFEAHIRELARGGYTVRPLEDIVAALKAGRGLPDRTVGISIDDAFLSVYREGWPRLRAAGLPFTLFVATDSIDHGDKDYMSWDQIRELARAGVAIGSQTASHPHMPELSAAEVARELSKSNARFESELGFRPRLFAYPYGEAGRGVMDAVRGAGFSAAFGQHSGVLHEGADFDYLPRFAMNEEYGDIDRFRLAVRALPLYATEVTPTDPLLGPNPPAFGFTVGKEVAVLEGLACYSSAHGKLKVVRLGARRIEVRPPSAFARGRSRINCTLPAGAGRWRWFGMQFYLPRG